MKSIWTDFLDAWLAPKPIDSHLELRILRDAVQGLPARKATGARADFSPVVSAAAPTAPRVGSGFNFTNAAHDARIAPGAQSWRVADETG